MPDDVVNYTHRSGRTGRAGKRGTSISIIHLREKGKVRIIEKVIGKKFEAGTLPEPQEICTKQLYKVMDELERIEVNDTEIAPFLPEIFRKLEWLTKEDLIKRIVSREFGHFLRYYADAPVIEQPADRKGSDDDTRKSRRERRKGAEGGHQAEEGYTRLFINLGKRDNFYAREIINLVNRYVKGGKVEIGRIDLTNNCSFFEVPNEDADLVLSKMKRVKVRDRKALVDHADRFDVQPNGRRSSNRRAEKPERRRGERRTFAEAADPRAMKQQWKKEKKSKRKDASKSADYTPAKQSRKKDDWRQFFES